MLTTTNTLAAYLYLHLGDQMPAPVLNEDGEIDVVADNAAIEAWALALMVILSVGFGYGRKSD